MTWLLPTDLAALLQVNVRTIQRWCTDRKLPHRRIGKTIRFTPDDVREIEEAYSVRPMVQLDVDAPNPVYASNPVVVPMRRSPRSAGR